MTDSRPIQLSRRVSAVEPSVTLSLNAKAQALSQDGVKVFNFTVGEPDYSTPKVIVDQAIKSLNEGRTKYGSAGGGLPLRRAISTKLRNENSLSFEPGQIVCGVGAKEILFHVFLSILNDGDEVILSAPYWVSYADQIKAAGGLPCIIPMEHDFSRAAVSSASIRKHETSKTRAFVLNSPNNPSGYVLSESELIDIGSYLSEKDWWIISDEIYEYLAFDRPHVSLLSLFPQLAERFIYVNGLSKSFAMTGWRVGYCAVPPAVSAMVRNLQSHSSTCLPGFIEDAAVVAVNSGKKLMSAEIASLTKRRDIAYSMLSRKFHCAAPMGAFYIFFDVRSTLVKGETTLAFCQRILERAHVALVPGEAFGAPGYVRLSYAQNIVDLEMGIEKFLKELR